MWWNRLAMSNNLWLSVLVVAILMGIGLIGLLQVRMAENQGETTALTANNALGRPPIPGAKAKLAALSGQGAASARGNSAAGGVGPQISSAGAETQTPAPTATATPKPTPALPPSRVGLQAGHWEIAKLPAELAMLRSATGTQGGGVTEPQLALDIAQRVAALLQGQGIEVDILPATVPPGYQADAFVSLHADGVANEKRSGFKLARPAWSVIPDIDDSLLSSITEEYGAVTQLRLDSNNVTLNMTNYYAFNNRNFRHTVAPSTPSVILEMGYLTSPSDREVLLGAPETVAYGIAQGIVRFLTVQSQS